MTASSAERKSNRLKAVVIACLLTAGYFAVRIPWVLSLPLMECPDEVNHLWVVQFLCDHLRMPSAQELAAAGKFSVYGALPPVGYFGSALAAYFNQGQFFRLAARVGTMICGLPCVFAAYYLGRAIFVRRLLAIVLPLLVILHPQLVFYGFLYEY